MAGRILLIITGRPGMAKQKRLLIRSITAGIEIVEGIAGHNGMELVAIFTAVLQEMLRQQCIKRLLLLCSSNAPIRISHSTGRLHWHWLAEEGESQQQTALCWIKLLDDDIIQQIACYISCPDVCVDWHLEEGAQTQVTVA